MYRTKDKDMNRHTVELEGLRQYFLEGSATYASSYGKGSCKELRFTFKGTYEVWHNKERVMVTIDPEKAIEKYNDLP